MVFPVTSYTSYSLLTEKYCDLPRTTYLFISLLEFFVYNKCFGHKMWPVSKPTQFSMVRHVLVCIRSLNSPYSLFSVSTCRKIGFLFIPFHPSINDLRINIHKKHQIKWNPVIISVCFTGTNRPIIYLYDYLLFDSYVYLFWGRYFFSSKVNLPHLMRFVYWASQT